MMRLIDADKLKEAFFERGLGHVAIDEIIDEAPEVIMADYIDREKLLEVMQALGV